MNEFSLTKNTMLPLGIAAAPQADAEGEESIVTRYTAVLWRRRWLVLGAIAVALAIGLAVTLLMTPLYKATTRLEINRIGAQIVNVQDVEPETTSVDQEFYQTQYGILQSRALAERVARELRLADDANFFALFDAQELADELQPGQGTRAAGGRERRLRAAVDILLENVDISPIRLSKLVDISWTSPDPALSARIANAWASSFVQHNMSRRYEATAFARRFLEERLGQLRRRLEESERELVNYASSQALINVPTGAAASEPGGAAPERSLTAESLSALNAELAQASADRIRAESRLRRTARGASNEALTNPTINTLRQRRAEAAAEYQRLMVQFEPGYPVARALAAQIEQLDQSIAREEARVEGSLSTAYQSSVQRERALSQQLEGLKQSFIDQRRRGIQYNIFQRDVDTNRQLYDALLQRYKEIGVAGGIGENNVLVVDDAEVPRTPAQPRPVLNLLLALLIGTALGVALAFIREQMDETINEPGELEKRVGVPTLGMVPKSATDNPLKELRDPKSNLIEACLSILTNLGFSTDHGVPKILAVTSTRPAEGKSTTAQAIAYVIARQGARTLLVDGDMRSPSLHHNMGLTNRKGLSTFLSGSDNLEELVQRPAEDPFFVMTAGPQPPNAAELLRTNRLQLLMSELGKAFDHVVIDCPPVLGLADAPVIAAGAEGTVFVVEAHRVKARVARQSIGRLLQGRAKVIGAVLTKFEPKRSSYGYGYGYGDGYGYGYGRDESKAA